jgi:hypothetical protein
MCGQTFSRKPSNLIAKSGLFFCSRKCKEAAQSIGGIKAIQPGHYGTTNGIYGYRERALRHYGSRCQSCGYEKDVRMLDVDHIDSNRSNAALSNLQILCVWCHALKTRGVGAHNRLESATQERFTNYEGAKP